jgi:D-glycero-D-manno-heptose 1,7-bisphosphate phosphatase
VRPAVFFDRDGVVNQLTPDPHSGLPESPLDVSDVVLVPGAGAALAGLQRAGFAVVGISNQPAAAKETVTLATLEAVQERVLSLLDGESFRPDGFYLCFHHPDGTDAKLSGPCDCRKPAPGLLLRAAADLSLDLNSSWMIGDTDDDALAGRSAGCRCVLVENRGSAHKRRGGVEPDERAESLPVAAEAILRASRRTR